MSQNVLNVRKEKPELQTLAQAHPCLSPKGASHVFTNFTCFITCFIH